MVPKLHIKVRSNGKYSNLTEFFKYLDGNLNNIKVFAILTVTTGKYLRTLYCLSFQYSLVLMTNLKDLVVVLCTK